MRESDSASDVPAPLAGVKASRRSSAVYYDTISASPEDQRLYKIMTYARFGTMTFLLIIIILSLADVIPLMDTMGGRIVDDFRDMKVGGGFLYVLVATCFSIICVPSSLLALAAGYIWENTGIGFIVSWPGILCGATISFTLGRFLFRECMELHFRNWLKFAALSQASEEHGYKVVFFGRLSPVPFGLLNYAFSVSQITFLQFILASAVGLVPICVGYAKVGSDFYTYFETSELQSVVGDCQKALTIDKGGGVTCQNQCNYPISYNMSQSCWDVTNTEKKTGIEQIYVDALDVIWPQIRSYCSVAQQKKVYGCLQDSAGCSFSKIKEEASDLNCHVNDAHCVEDDTDHNECLKDLNDSELWPKIVLPIALFFTLCIVYFFGNRALQRAGLLQVTYNLDNQKELLLAEQAATKAEPL